LLYTKVMMGQSKWKFGWYFDITPNQMTSSYDCIAARGLGAKGSCWWGKFYTTTIKKEYSYL